MATDHRAMFVRPNDEDDDEMQQAIHREDLSWRRALGFLWRMLARHPLLVTASILLGLGIAAAEVVSLGLLFPFIASIGGNGSALTDETKLAFLVPYFQGYSIVAQIRIIAVGLLAVQLFKGFLGYLAGRVASYQKILLDRDLRAEIFDQIVDLDLRYIHKERVANLFTILHAYSNSVGNAAKRLLTAVPKGASFVGYAVSLFLISWELTLIALVLAAATTRAIGFITARVRRLSRKINVHSVRLKHVSLEALNGLKVIHLFGREKHARDRFHKQLVVYQNNKFHKSSIDAAVGPIYSTMMTAMFAGILVAATFLLDTSATAWVALLTMFMVVMFRLMAPTAAFAKARTKLAGDLPSLEQIMDFLERDDKPYLVDGTESFPGLREAVQFEDVWFRYDDEEPDVIRGLSFEVPKGRTVALVGGSGAGKSTTVNLLARLYDPTGGRITVDGTDLRTYRVATWRRRIAVVSQDTFLFNDSVRENIRFGRLDASDAEVEAAAREANAHEFVVELPEGYETSLGDRGVRLSGGQAQRIAIARAILADPELLILDEATSALDTATERRVQEAIERVSRDRTVVAIAHRLSTIRNADQILVIEGGTVVERGTHEELLARRGHYHAYVQMQTLSGGSQPAPPVPAVAPAPNGRSANGHDDVRLVLRAGRHGAELRHNGHAIGEVRVVPLDDDADEEGALANARGDVALVRKGRRRALVRIGDHVHRDVRLYLQRPAPNGDPSAVREVRARVQDVRGRPR